MATSTPKNGAQSVARCLARMGVRRVFSVSGNQILSIYDGLLAEGIPIVHTRHESAAVHMADAQARLSGEPGVVLVSAGPGHANALGGLAFAAAAESPVVLLSGHAPLAQAGAGAFQEMDQAGLARPLCRWSAVLRRAEDAPTLIAQAFRAAQAGRPGPVHLSLPTDVLADSVSQSTAQAPESTTLSPPEDGVPKGAFAAAVTLLRSAERPLIVAGPLGGRPGIYQPLHSLADHTGIPLLIVDHPRGLGDPALGRAGQALPRADALLLFAKRQDYRLSYAGSPPLAPGCRLVQIDPEPDEIGRHRPAEVAIVAEAATAARHLLALAAREEWPQRAWTNEVEQLRRASVLPQTIPDLDGEPLHPLRVFDALSALLDQIGEDEATVVLDGGEFGQWGRARLRLMPPRHLVSEPSGGIGFAVPFAISARLTRPDSTVIAVAGDGGFGFYGLELETAARCGAPFLAVVGTDGAWGTERHLQAARYGADRTVATDLLPARYDQLAAALGGHGEYVQRAAELAVALERALGAVRAGRPAVVNVRIRSMPSPAPPP